MKSIARVFPRKTNASPDDAMAFFDVPPMLALPEVDEVHISVAFTYDLPRAEWLAKQWGAVGVPVKMGGPAFNEPGEDFVPGRYLKRGYVITSRGCPNRCWFCAVPKREGYKLRELPVTSGWDVLDDNLLACSEEHIREVFKMLAGQTERPIFSGGLEARLLKPWHVELLRSVGTKRMFFAYDTPDDREPLFEAGKILMQGGFTKESHSARCYVLIGYDGDTIDKAQERLVDAWRAGFTPFAMLYRPTGGEVNKEWLPFARQWIRAPMVICNLKKMGF